MGRPIIVITDAADLGDDGVAVAMLLAHPEIDVRLIVCTSGNVWFDEVARNVTRLLNRLGKRDVPTSLHPPAPELLDRAQSVRASAARAKLGYLGAFTKPPPQTVQTRGDTAQLRAAIEAAACVDLLVLAPPSPVAQLWHDSPDTFRQVGRVYVMGGALHVPGNASPEAEFNFWFDPPATDTLLAADLDMLLLPLDVANFLSYPDIPADPRKPAMSYLREYLARRGKKRGIWDEAVSAILLKPGLIQSSLTSQLRAEREGPHVGKLTLVDNLHRRKIKIVTAVNRTDLVQSILSSLS